MQGVRSDGSYYMRPTHRYGFNLFQGVGEQATRQKLYKQDN